MCIGGVVTEDERPCGFPCFRTSCTVKHVSIVSLHKQFTNTNKNKYFAQFCLFFSFFFFYSGVFTMWSTLPWRSDCLIRYTVVLGIRAIIIDCVL